MQVRAEGGGNIRVTPAVYVALLAAVATLALWLRFPFPEPGWQHVDERAFILQPLAFFSGDLNPHFFNYPTLQLYLASAIYWLYHALFSSASIESFVAYRYFVDASDLIFISRVVTTLMAVGTVIAAASLGRRLYGEAGGLIAALTLAVIPLHVRFSHLAATDVPAALWTTLAVLWAVRIVEEQRPRDLLIAGVFVGLAASTKYPGVFCVVPVAVAAWQGPNRMGRCLRAGAAALALTSPFLWLSPLEAWQDISAMGVEHLAGDNHRPNGGPLLHLVEHTLRYGLGFGVLLTVLIAVGWRPRSMTRAETILCAGIAGLALLPAVASSGFMRYAIPLAPVLAVLAARPLVRLPLPRWGLGAWLLVVLAVPAYASWQSRTMLSGPDTRLEALGWLEARHADGYRLIQASGSGGAPGFLTPEVILARETYFLRSYSDEQLRQAYAELARRSDFPPLAVRGLSEDAIVAAPDSASGSGILCLIDHPILVDEENRYEELSRWPLDWVDFRAGRLARGVFDPVDWLLLPVDGFSYMRATGPNVRLATVGLPLAAPVPDTRSYFALRGAVMDAKRAVGEDRYAEAQALYDHIFSSPFVMAELLTKILLVELYTGAGMAHFQQGEPGLALTLWQRSLEMRPNDAIALTNVGTALTALKRYDEALAHMERAASLSAWNADLLYNLGTLYLRLSRFTEGAKVLERAVALRPEADGFSNLGWACLRLGRRDDAARSLRSALALDPDHEQARRGLDELNRR